MTEEVLDRVHSIIDQPRSVSPKPKASTMEIINEQEEPMSKSEDNIRIIAWTWAGQNEHEVQRTNGGAGVSYSNASAL